MRLIDADALYKDIHESMILMTALGFIIDGKWLWARLNNALDRAPTIEAMRWTPCSERLPEKDGHYLVCAQNDVMKTYMMTAIGYFKPNCGSFRFDEEQDGFHVIAWMPLPPAYQGIKCDTCIHRYEDWDSPACDGCTVGNSNYEEE